MADTLRVITSKVLYCGKNILCNFQVVFVVGMCLGIQILLSQHRNVEYSDRETEYPVYYWQKNLKISFTSYAKGVVYKLTILPDGSEARVCNSRSFELHTIGGLPIRHVGLFQTLGSTNVHAISGHVDDRLHDKKFIRIIAVGLFPGPGATIFCNYNCQRSPANFCSVPSFSVVLLAGNDTDYGPTESRKSLMDLLAITCPVRQEDEPVHASLAHEKCGYSHNQLSLNQFTFQGVMAPMWDVGVCVRPWPATGSAEEAYHLALWLEYLRLLGADHVHMYVTGTPAKKLQQIIDFYQNETFRLLTTKDWTIVAERTEDIVNDEAAINDCLYSNMMKYRYVLVISQDQWPTFSMRFQNLKQLVRSDSFRRSIDELGGFKLVSTSGRRSSLIVKPRLMMNLAADHFVPLSARPSFRQLDRTDISLVSFSRLKSLHPFDVAKKQLEHLVVAKFSRAGIKLNK